MPTLNPQAQVEMTPQTFNPNPNFTQAMNHQPSNLHLQQQYPNMPPPQMQPQQMQP